MVIAQRLDHLHLVVRSADEWVPLFRDLLGLQIIRGTYAEALDPAYATPRGNGAALAEFQIGDGFIAVMQPAPADQQMSGFLEKRGEGFYALSFDVGNLNRAAAALQQRDIPFLDTRRPAESGAESSSGFLWISPRLTGGTAIQLSWPWPTDPGANTNLIGLRSAIVAVRDVDAAVATYSRLLDLKETSRIRDDRCGYEGAVLAIGASPDTLVLASSSDDSKPLGQLLAQRGPGIFQFTIATKNLDTEITRLRVHGVSVERSAGAAPPVAWLDLAVFRGVRIELREES